MARRYRQSRPRLYDSGSTVTRIAILLHVCSAPRIVFLLTSFGLLRGAIFAGRNVTTHKTSIITVKQFRPFMTRVPIGPTKGMSATDHIALDVQEFTLPGAFNEPAWGEPKPVELQPDIHEWVQGLRQSGGAG